MSDKNSKKPIQISTVSKQSTAQATDSRKSKARWFRYVPKQPELPELDHIFDLYWGGPERRITSLTLKIISVNMIALITLLFGVLYLGQYQNNIIETKLENFEREADIIAIAISGSDINAQTTKDKIAQIIKGTDQHVQVYDKNANLVFSQKASSNKSSRREELQSIKILKNTAGIITNLLPDTKAIPKYPENTDNGLNVPDLDNALSGLPSLSAWQDADDEILLSAGLPIIQNDETIGAIIILREGRDIKAAIGEVWSGIIKIFLATLLITLFLSIFLANAIANPLKKLAKAAEAVRTGRATGDDIPDLSQRYDEIGDLSVVLRSMTDALWAKMDSIESFAADVSHELKNPLTSLKSAIETLQRVSKQEDREKLMAIINHDIQRMDRLITDISSASRLDAELSREAFSTIKINDIICQLLESYKDPIQRKTTTKENEETFKTTNGKTIRLVTNKGQNSITRGAKTRLLQVFQNLIDNALSFSKEGDTVTITINRGENLIAIHIDDEGQGIPENKLETIFDRFYTQRPDEFYGQNSGLGLSISKQIIESHRGEIFAENRRDADGNIIGARFNVILKAK
ncbi:MAG: HAMP domain-containing protein [Alphaproteobacteria bacterium]|nr:HAMP domain-containing protein [Alphaproteobacteria bacterium]